MDVRTIAAIERLDLLFRERLWSRIPADVAGRYRATVLTIDGALVTMMAKSSSLQTNRVLGLGVTGPAGAGSVDRILAAAREARVKRLAFVLAPGGRQAALAEAFERRGLRPRGGLAVLTRDASPPASVDTTLDVREISAAPDEGRAFVEMMGDIFALPRGRFEWAASAIGQPGAHHFLAWDGTRPVAAGALLVDGAWGMLTSGATRTRWRRRGAHAALIAARIARARALGVRHLATMAAEPARGRPSGSFRNLARAGFSTAYRHQTWVWDETRGRKP
jgi:hypothetical protein